MVCCWERETEASTQTTVTSGTWSALQEGLAISARKSLHAGVAKASALLVVDDGVVLPGVAVGGEFL